MKNSLFEIARDKKDTVSKGTFWNINKVLNIRTKLSFFEFFNETNKLKLIVNQFSSLSQNAYCVTVLTSICSGIVV